LIPSSFLFALKAPMTEESFTFGERRYLRIISPQQRKRAQIISKKNFSNYTGSKAITMSY